MQKYAVQMALEGVREARHEWNKAKRQFDTDVEKVIVRLLHEAAANRMSVHEVSKFSGLSPKRIRDLMRSNRLNPRDGKMLLAKTAAEALESNADLLGVPVHEMDLMSPLAYLPMGEQMRLELREKAVARVTELPEVSGNDEPLRQRILTIHQPSKDHRAGMDPYCLGCWHAGGMDGAPSYPCETALVVL